MSRSVAARVLARGLARPLGMAIAGAAFLLPFLWTLSTSLKPKAMILQVPPTFLPWPPTLENYANVFSSGFLRYLMNSSIVAVCTVIVVVTVSIHTGYAVSRFRFRGKAAMLFLILIGMAMGELSTVLPLYFFGSRVGLLDTYAVLILANSAFIAPLAIWFMQGYFHSIPIQIEEAALIDGTSRLGALYRVVIPSASPGLVTVAVISFVQSWNEFILALVLTSSGSMRTVPVGMHLYMTDYGVDWGNITAAGVVSIVPVLILFIFMQRHFVRGLTAGATTGL